MPTRRKLPPLLAKMVKTHQKRRRAAGKKLQTEQLYETLRWLQRESERHAIPFRSLLRRCIVLGATRLGLHPPRPITRDTPVKDDL